MLRIVFALMLLGTISASRVIELNNKLLDIYPKDERGFLIKFYAPWCHYCHEFGKFSFHVVYVHLCLVAESM